MKKGKLSNKDHNQMDAFLDAVLEDFKNGLVSKEAVASGFSHVIAAVDIGNHDEARQWFMQGRSFIREQSES